MTAASALAVESREMSPNIAVGIDIVIERVG